MRTRSIAACAVTAVLSLLATGCSSLPGSSAQPSAASTPTAADPLTALSAADVAKKSFADFKAASAVHVAGALDDMTLNLTLGTKTCKGTITQKGSGSFEILQSGSTVWIKPDDQFWKSAGGGTDQSVLNMLDGKYLKTTTKDKDFASVLDLCDPAKLGAQFGSDTTGLVKGKVTAISGQPALPLSDTGDSGTLDVSDVATPELLRMRLDSGHQLDFTAYGVPARVTAPPAGETLSGPQYGL